MDEGQIANGTEISILGDHHREGPVLEGVVWRLGDPSSTCLQAEKPGFSLHRMVLVWRKGRRGQNVTRKGEWVF
jgi:hypothetical protein